MGERLSPERSICFVINGEDVPLVVPKDLPLGKAKRLALDETKNTGRALIDWDVREPGGFILNDSTPVAELDVVWGEVANPHRGADSPLPLIPSTRVFLTLKMGAGGTKGVEVPKSPP